jgi:hypothetical protein
MPSPLLQWRSGRRVSLGPGSTASWARRSQQRIFRCEPIAIDAVAGCHSSAGARPQWRANGRVVARLCGFYLEAALRARSPPHGVCPATHRRCGLRISSHGSIRNACASRPNTVTLAETVARSIDPRYRALRPARCASSSWVNFLTRRSRRTLIAMAPFKSMDEMANMPGTMLPGTIVPIILELQ